MVFDHAGLLIIRAWTEPGSSKPLRAHIRFTTDIGDGFGNEQTLADVSAVSAVVEAWLQEVMLESPAQRADAEPFPKP
jgi:hypothetical protein